MSKPTIVSSIITLIGVNETMPLKDVLKLFQWGKYEAEVYNALVEGGPMKANDLAMKAGVPQARVYNILDNLESKGCVLKKGLRPTIYFAQNPRIVIEEALGALELKAKAVASESEQK